MCINEVEAILNSTVQCLQMYTSLKKVTCLVYMVKFVNTYNIVLGFYISYSYI